MIKTHRRFAFPIGLFLAVLTPGCGGDIVLPVEGEAADLEIVSGDEQLGPAGATLADQVVVRVLDTRDRPVPNQDVTFSIGSGGGSVAPATVKSDAAGRATAAWTLGPNSGSHMLRVQTPRGGSGSLEVTVRATAVAGSGSILVEAGGDEQTGPVNSALADSLVVRATDALGNPVANVEVTWSVSGGGSIDPVTIVTGADGLAAAERVLGPTAGAQSAQATVPGFAGSPVTFTHTSVPANPTALVKISGDGQTAPGGFEAAEDLVVRLEDNNGNGIGGRAITWVVPAGSGSVDPVNATTNANGLVTTRWTLPSAVGSYGVSAVFSGLPAVPFTGTATADVPTTIELVSGNNQNAVVGGAVANPLVVRVTDANDNPVANVGVAWTAVNGGSVSVANTATDASGLAQVMRTLGLVPGPYMTTAAVDGLSGSPITFTSTATVGPPAKLAITQQPGGPTTSGAAFAPPFVIQLQDLQGNAVGQGGIEVTATIASGQSGASLVGTNPRNTNGSGRATFSGLGISGPPDDDYVVTFAATGGETLTPVSSSALTVTAGGASEIVIILEPSSSAQSGDPFAQQPSVRIEDGSGNPVNGSRTVAVELGQGAGNGTLTGTLTASTNGGSTATFTNLAIAGETGDYTLLFRSGTLDVDESSPISIVNNPPTAANDGYSVDEDGVLTVPVASGVLANDTDPDGDNLTAVNASSPADGTVVLNSNGSFTYTPDPDFNGTDAFTYQANDGQGNVSGSATVTITVNAVNDVPEFIAGSDVSVSALASALGFSQNNWATGISPGPSDESGSGQTVEFQVSLDDPSDSSAFVVLPQVDPDGTLTFTTLPTLVELTINASVVADDGDATSAPQTFTITITIP